MKNGKTLKEGVLHECPVEEEKGFEKKAFSSAILVFSMKTKTHKHHTALSSTPPDDYMEVTPPTPDALVGSTTLSCSSAGGGHLFKSNWARNGLKARLLLSKPSPSVVPRALQYLLTSKSSTLHPLQVLSRNNEQLQQGKRQCLAKVAFRTVQKKKTFQWLGQYRSNCLYKRIHQRRKRG